MSWEVLTMRSATSFFNPALARSDLRRYWPALFLYVGLWIIFLPVQLWLMAHQGYVPAPDLGVICSDRYIAAVIMALIFGRHDGHGVVFLSDEPPVRGGHARPAPAAGDPVLDPLSHRLGHAGGRKPAGGPADSRESPC